MSAPWRNWGLGLPNLTLNFKRLSCWLRLSDEQRQRLAPPRVEPAPADPSP